MLAVVILLAFLFLAKPALAVTVTIANVPPTVTDQPFEFNVSVGGANAGTNYIRANFSQVGTFNYFGYTYNGTTFVNSSTCPDYLAVTIDSSGNWSGTVQAKIDTTSNFYSGPGTYNFKVRRYTQSCSSSSYIWSNEIVVNTNTTSPSTSPSPSQSPTQSSSSTTSSSFTISNIPSEIDSDQTFTVSIALSLSNSPNTKFYLKGALKKSDSSNYFGLTKVGSSWIKNGGSFSDQYQITTDPSGNWSGTIEVQPDVLDSGYDGVGDYIFKVGRYTSSGSGPTWTSEQTTKINAQEVETGNSLIDLSKISGLNATSVPSNKYSSKDKLPDAVYTLENYRKTGSIAGVGKEATTTVSVAGEKSKNPFLIFGGILILLGIGSGGVIIALRFHRDAS